MNDDFEILQHDWEFEQLLALIPGARCVLELGVWQGGTLQQFADRVDRVVGVDMNLTENAHAVEGKHVTLIEGNTHDPAIIGAVREHGPFDLVFLDADHGVHPATQDWQNYSPMVKLGGIFAFHDIRPTSHATLNMLWAEIKREPGRKTIEFNHFNADWGGIGVAYF